MDLLTADEVEVRNVIVDHVGDIGGVVHGG
jgi:hypothetical protein